VFYRTRDPTSAPAEFFSSQIIAILAAILFPVFARAREKARQTSCASNEKQMGTAVLMYAQDYDERTPLHGCTWRNYSASGLGETCYAAKLDPYIKNMQIWRCPSEPDRGPSIGGSSNGYGWNLNYMGGRSGIPIANIKMPAETIWIADANAGYIPAPNCATASWGSSVTTPLCSPNAPQRILERHNGGANFVWADGHVKWMKVDGKVLKTNYYWLADK